jgi:hypothetical protein
MKATENQKTYKGQIDETWEEIDLTDFLKDNPRFDTRNNQKEKTDEGIDCL